MCTYTYIYTYHRIFRLCVTVAQSTHLKKIPAHHHPIGWANPVNPFLKDHDGGREFPHSIGIY